MTKKTTQLSPNEEVKPAQQTTNVFNLGSSSSRVAVHIVSVNLRLVFDLKTPILMGRGVKSDPRTIGLDLTPFQADQLGVSRQHAKILHKEGRIYVSDQGSMNGTYLNDAKLEPNIDYEVKQRDKLLLGRFLVEIELLTSDSMISF